MRQATKAVRLKLSLCVFSACMILINTGCAESAPKTVSTLVAPNTLEVTGDEPPRWEGAIPNFTGPWAKEFRDAYEYSGSNFERAVLRDGVITELELAEMRNRFSRCLEAHGATEIAFTDSSAWSLRPPKGLSDAAEEAFIKKCGTASGEPHIAALYDWVRRNPQNLDENTIMAACLVRKGAKGPDYSADDYAREDDTDSSGVFSTDAFRACNADPLGRFEKADS